MHMADALVSPAVGGAMLAVSAGAIAYSVIKTKEDLDDKKVPVMGVMGAFVFAAQMINFTIPVTGSSGHIGGGILLAALLGPYPAFLTITAVLLIQALFFADGGLLALGCNIFNMGFYACFIAYPLIYKQIVKKGLNPKTITIASITSVIIGLQLGAFSVVLETLASGITELPFSAFVALMQPIHLAIGLVEGIITAAVLTFVYQMRPEILDSAVTGKKIGAVSVKKVVTVLIVLTLIVGGGLSLFASSYPDGLEWSMQGVTGSTELETDAKAAEAAAALQEKTAFMPDYGFKSAGEEGSTAGTSTAGIVGGTLTLLLAGLSGLAVATVKKNKKSKAVKSAA
ncbi:MAG: energy-coupling factor ABC transporter permease [Clostridia bacterium]|nr:energy-coupling factor ABC transporter permease [Clostridia bacterium]